jgi:putative membrane protein
MNKIRTLKSAAALACSSACFAACFAAGSASAATEPMKPSGAMEAVMSNSEKDFFESAASSNMFEVQASKLAQTKASDPKLKAFAEKMISDHTEASDKLMTLAQSKNVTLPTTLLKRHQSMLDALNKDKPGKDFDEDYKNKMVMTHKEAISLFDQTAKNAKDPEVKSFAAMLLPKLQMHGGMANDLNAMK